MTGYRKSPRRLPALGLGIGRRASSVGIRQHHAGVTVPLTTTTSQTHARCNHCGGSRWHQVLHALKEQTPGDDSRVVRYELLRCAGCEEVKLRKTVLASSDRSTSAKVKPRVTYYPPSAIRPQPRWFQELMFEEWIGDATAEHALLVEVYAALENGAPTLAAMGVRAIVETIMVNTVKDQGSFSKNLATMKDRGSSRSWTWTA
jgi:hypothetical protein